METEFILNAMKLAYRLAEAEHVHFSKWKYDQEIERELTIHLAYLLEDKALEISKTEEAIC